MAKEYKNQNEQIWGEGGTGYYGQMGQAGSEAQKRQDDPTYGQAYTNDGLQNAIDTANQNGAGITGSIHNYSQYDTPRTETPGSAAADESHLSDGSYQYIQYCKDMWNKVDQDPSLTPEQKAEQKAYWHNEAEKVRARSGYSGGADGSMFITNGEMNVAGGNYSNYGSAGGSRGAGGSGANGMGGYLDAWQQAALAQSNGQIDYAVQKAVADLERALADAQPQFKEQAESVDRNARQAMDNSALYAEMRGDKGGIGQEQYNSIQNTQAQNHLAVQQAQTKLATDTQRQIADLRAQGEFEKADAALQITQQYLQQLIGLEQWAAEYNLSVEQFNASLQQWQAEYDMAMQQFEYGKQTDTANIGWALLESGVPLTPEQLSAMGISEEQATKILMQQQLASAGVVESDGANAKMTLSTAKDLAKNGIFNEQVLSVLHQNGYSDEAISTIYGYVPEQPTNVEPTGAQAANYETLKGHVNAYPSRGITISDIAYMIESALQRGNITDAQAEELLNLIDQKVG